LYTQEQQNAIAGAARLKPGQALRILAFAGSGKTTTLKGVAAQLQGSVAYLAFNREIAREAQVKFRGTNTKASTMHSLAMGAVRSLMTEPPLASVQAREVVQSDAFKKAKFPATTGWNPFRLSIAVSRTMVHFAQSDSAAFSPEHAKKAIIDALGDPRLMKPGVQQQRVRNAMDRLAEPLALVARDIWVSMERAGRFTHDMYLKRLDWSEKARQAAFSGFDHLMIDEAQDINPVQRSIVVKTGLPLIAVGDPYQQIYSWRGAENALASLPGSVYHLTQSFRFAEPIAALARGILRSRPDGGPKERLVGAGTGNAGGHTGIPWAVICRTNMGVIDAALDFLNDGYPMRVDNIDGLLKDLRSAEALFAGELDKVESPEFRIFNSWKELKEEAEEGNQTLNKIVQMVERKRVKAVAALAKVQKQGSGGPEPQVFLCTAHRSKGLEFPRVTLGGDWKPLAQMHARYAKASPGPQKTLAMEEWNALYVASTRAMVTLEGLDAIMG
jgi:hypothetical protein